MWEGIDISGKWRLFSMVFNGSGSIVRNQNKSWKFRNYEILRKSEEIKRNFFNKKASDIHKYFPGNWTRPNDEVPYIRDGLLKGLKSMILQILLKNFRRKLTKKKIYFVVWCAELHFYQIWVHCIPLPDFKFFAIKGWLRGFKTK